jgi:cytochrome c biogenesis protein CcmG/thiol:disulfide interchange protein DsbE
VRARRAPIIAGIVGVAVLALVVLFVVSPSGEEKVDSSPLVGNVAPALVGTTASGDEFDIDDHRGQWVLVNFFATWCPPCVQEHPELVELSERTDGRLQVVSVAYNDEDEKVTEFFETNGGSWPVLLGGADGASLDYGVKKLPESFLVDPSGTVAVKLNGAVTTEQIDQLIADRTGS